MTGKEDILKRSIIRHHTALSTGEYSAEQLTLAYFDAIERENPTVNAYVCLCKDRAILAAKASDKRRSQNVTLGVLDGIPFAAKDNISAKGLPLSCASKILSDYVAPYDATVISLLEAEGAILLGKTNLDEFAMGTGSESSCFGRVKNPLDLSRVAGGSSGGSAAAVCAGLACFALGSDTGGSVRQPAAFCGLYGLRPTYSAISRYGLVGFAPSLDTVGIIARNAYDCACVLDTLAIRDPLDATSQSFEKKDFFCNISKDIRGITVALVKESAKDLSKEATYAFDLCVDMLKMLGAKLKIVSLPSFESAYAAYYTISSAEASSNLSRFDGVRYGYRAYRYDGIESLYVKSRSQGLGNEVKRRILFGALALSSGFRDDIYVRAINARNRIAKELDDIMKNADILLIPTASTVAYVAGAKKSSRFDAYIADDLLCVPASLAGLPSLSVPISDGKELPCGIQLVGSRFEEAKIFNVAEALGNFMR